MVIYVGENEQIRIQEIDEANGDLRIGVYNESWGESILIKVFDDITEAEKFADELYLEIMAINKLSEDSHRSS